GFIFDVTNRTGVGGVKIAEAFHEGRGAGGGGNWQLPAAVALYGIAPERRATRPHTHIKKKKRL
ncbi:hypothetical protein, partial [Escherichia coli]|uniref:hypothetical protein n=1 Tax=Escherichia coli TaxID=562 RepID=UPI001BAEE497